ncbi:hypothetical protein G7Y89_g9489 [Cudoniella acicularis]|uniref:F-box domain-containing protein n=1 Tax=Cudoniella acicularis TaxID=354080 RepID=A0A8H4RFI7_9HELO|nr:hypothetical protein G7Y89_g9489 [Cudoniella acicularis]
MTSPLSLTDDEFRLLTWPRPTLSQMTIQPESLRRHCPLDNGRLLPRPVSLSNLGNFDILPLEIIHSIFINFLDLQRLTDFRAVSWRARTLVDDLPPYHAIVRHSPDSLRALLSTQMAVHFTTQDIFQALCTEACFGCGQHGPFLDLFTGHRRCIPCVLNSNDLMSIPTLWAKKDFALNSKAMRTLPTLLSLPGQYTESEKTYQKRTSLVRTRSAAAIAASLEQEGSNGSRRRRGPLQRPVLPSSQPQQPQQPRQLPVSRRDDGHGMNPHRFMPMIRFPSLDRRTGTLDWGASCQACRLGPRDEKRGYSNWNNVYSATGYLDHFQKCEVSQVARKVVPEYIIPATGGDQCMSDARFLGFLSRFKF